MTKASVNRAPAAKPSVQNDLFRQFFGFPFNFGTEDLGVSYGPAIDIYEDTDGFYLAGDVPGFSADNFQVKYENRTLTVSGERKNEEIEGVKYHRKESYSGRFQRTFSLPLDIDADKITAELKDGVLTICLPKQEANKPRQISINVG
ncbi:MAG: Hsp20/alpha crystallin family protein [Blastocatellia bacterium]|nr:Hsp20/alpha crystallin family protein [Blastocatellia bacterium]